MESFDDRQIQEAKENMEHAGFPGTSLQVSRVTLGTWAIGGWMWCGTDEAESIATIRAAIDHGIDVIDTGGSRVWGLEFQSPLHTRSREFDKWQSIVPETFGEILHSGACRAN